MLNINFKNETSTKVDNKKIIAAVKEIFIKRKITKNAEASVTLVHHTEVVRLACLYMKETQKQAKDHPVLSFLNSELEEDFIFPPDNINHIGEIVISFEKAEEESKNKPLSLDEVVIYWAEHGALHLMEIHHD